MSLSQSQIHEQHQKKQRRLYADTLKRITHHPSLYRYNLLGRLRDQIDHGEDCHMCAGDPEIHYLIGLLHSHETKNERGMLSHFQGEVYKWVTAAANQMTGRGYDRSHQFVKAIEFLWQATAEGSWWNEHSVSMFGYMPFPELWEFVRRQKQQILEHDPETDPESPLYRRYQHELKQLHDETARNGMLVEKNTAA